MENVITIQVHDYDRCGRYVITEDRNTNIDEAHELREKARESVKIAWDALGPEYTHVVYYAELENSTQGVWFAGIFMHGQAYTDKDFEDIFWKPNVGYVGAFHKRV